MANIQLISGGDRDSVKPVVVNDRPFQSFRLTDASIVRRRASKLRDFRVEIECPRKRTRATARLTGTRSYDAGLGANGEPRIRDSMVNIGSETVFVSGNPSPKWCMCGRNAKRLKEVALLRAWMQAVVAMNDRFKELYGDAV